jgi:CzcA family heavy metal efflux pump
MKNEVLDNFYSRYKSPVIYLILLVLAGGIFFYKQINVSLFPEITFPKIKIIADNGEQPVDKMIVTVTKPLEEAIKQIPDLKLVKSTTSRGSCEISAFLDWKADINASQQFIESRINQIRGSLPPTVEITIEQMNPSILPVSGYILESKTFNLIEMRMLADYVVKPFLSQLEGISKIQVAGGKEKEYWVTLKQDKMIDFRITPAQIRDAFAKTNFINSNGFSTDYRRLYLSLTDAQIHDKTDLEQLVILNNTKRSVLLKDIADISINEKIEYVKINADGEEGVLVNIIKQPKTNLIELSQRTAQRIKELEKILPKGVMIKTYYDQAEFVDGSVKSVSDALLIGLLFAIVITFLFLWSFHGGMTLLFTIPSTLALTIIVMYSLDYTLNLMTLGAIAASVGLVIDDSIVVVEQIHRIREDSQDNKPSVLVHRAIKFLFPAMVGSSLSTIVIFLPFSFMSGVAGAYFKVLAYTMIITLVCSFFISWIALPFIYLIFFRNGKTAKIIQKDYKEIRIIKHLVKYPVYSIIFVTCLVILTVIIIPRLSTGFLPEMDEGSIVLDYKTPPGTSLEETDRILKQVDNVVNSNTSVDHYSRRTGTQLGFFITEPNNGDYLIHLKTDKKKSTDEVINEIRTELEQINLPIEVDFGQVVNDMLGDLMSSVQPVEIKIYGDKPELLREYAEKVAGIIDSVQGTADVFNGIVIAGPTIEYEPINEQLARYNIGPDELQFQIQNYVDGSQIGSILEKEQMTGIRLFNSKLSKFKSNDFTNYPIFLPDGTVRPANEFITAQVKEGVAEIDRENLKPMIAVTARLNQRDLGSVMSDIKNLISSKLYLPQGFSIVYGGAYAEQQRSFNELLLILLSACLLVLSVLLILFREIRGSVSILLVSLIGLSGCFLSLFIAGVPLNVGSYTGVIMIVGIIAENSVFTYFQFKNFLNQYSVDESIMRAVRIRLRPNLMTATGAIIALLPLALALGTGAQLHQPLAIAVIGGFIIAQPLLIIVLPTILKTVYRNEK